MNKAMIAKREKAEGARYVLCSPSKWEADLFFRSKDMAEIVREYRGAGKVMGIDEYIRRKEE